MPAKYGQHSIFNNQQKIGYDADYDVLLESIRQYLINPTAYVAEQLMTFEDLLIKEFCTCCF
jgi:hypothetical protein